MFQRYNAKMRNQFKEILGTFNESQQKTVSNITDVDLFKLLKYRVSYTCLSRLLTEYKKGEYGMHLDHCECVIRKRDGLLCVHDIYEYVRRQEPIPVEAVHAFWRTLTLKEVETEDELKVRRVVARNLMDYCHAIATGFVDRA